MTTGDHARGEYNAWLEVRVLECVSRGAPTLAAVVADADGADPLSVRDALRRITARDAVHTPALGRDSRLLGGSGDRSIAPSLPPPHPLDYEWRFSDQGANFLVRRARDLGGKDLCLVGATTVALAAERAGWLGRVTAFDANGVVLEAVCGMTQKTELLRVDVMRDGLPDVTADVVVVDPPWYPEHTASFLWASASVCAVGGHILISLPGTGTRPGVREERDKLVHDAAVLGLELMDHTAQSVAYETPFFEHNAMRAAGLTDSLGWWRRGDLLVFRRVGEGTGPRPNPPKASGEWEEVFLGGTRVRLRQRGGQCVEPALRSIVQGDILPTVSRRDPRRALADVWTSGNRVLACAAPVILTRVLRAQASGRSAVADVAAALERDLSSAERSSILAAGEHMNTLIRTESDEQAANAKATEGGPDDLA